MKTLFPVADIGRNLETNDHEAQKYACPVEGVQVKEASIKGVAVDRRAAIAK